ncbi:uncharacterized protein [Henckelia pumila]|uniref:uncharacterized protein n=1 Tax=Henckelia pumila TaxID=405737 RepID=UPI003C6DDA12
MADQNGNHPNLELLIAQAVQRALAERDEANIPHPDHNAHLEEIKKLKEEMEQLRKKQAGYWTLTFPKQFKLPHVGEYDGKGDPEEHLACFENAALLHKYSDPIKCRAFLTTLIGPAQQWFNTLRAGEIKEFKYFSKSFLHHFASSKKHPTTTFSLFAIKQREHENLRAYIRRFSALALEVPMATPDLLISAFMQGLDTKDFLKSLIKRPPETYEELLARAEKYVNMEEIQVSRAAVKRERPKSPKGNRVPSNGTGMGQPFRPALLGEFSSFTPLRMSKVRALQICDDRKLTQRPPWTEKGPRNRESDKYCHFHNEYGHITENCRQLDQEIERIIQQHAELKNILTRQEGYRPNKRQQERPRQRARTAPPHEDFNHPNQGQPDDDRAHQRPAPPARGIINMISGGPTDGDSNRARKTSSRKLINMEIGNQIFHTGPTLSFGPEDLKGVSSNHNDALVIRATVANYDVARIFVDSGSSVNVLFQEAINQMDLGQYKMEPVVTSLFGFTGHAIRPVGLVHLPLTLGKNNTRKTRIVSFIIVDAPSAYNAILGRPAMTTFMAVASALHQKMKFPVGNEVGEVQGDQVISRKCYVEEVRIEQKVARTDNVDRPGISVSDLVGVHREISEHKLNVIKGYRPIIQKKRHFGPEKDAVIKEQVDELLKVGHIEEIHFPTWLSNIVLVPKSTGKWRMCVDFRDLNKACPKDCYPLPRIDQLVDSTAGHELLSFLDAYQGYHQIPLAKEDKDKVSFVTSTGTYCYVVMPFGLKNAGATYQRLMDKVFEQQIGKNIEVYVDDILIKTRTADQFITDLAQTFQTLRNYQLKLNPSKCTFGVRAGKFLGYMVTRRGIEENPEKVQAIISMSSPRNVQEVQRLTGRITALARFISRSADKSLSLFKALRKTKNFEWNEESEKAFQDLKTYLKQLPVLNKPIPGEELFLYLAVTPRAASSVLVRKDGANHQPVYFVSHVLKGAELNYLTQEKLALALVITARKLRPYFLSHPITVLTNSVLGKIETNPDASGRLVRWITELSEYDLNFEPRTAIKAQALADFLAETVQLEQEELWKIFVDGSSCQSGSGAGIVIISPWGEETNISIRLDFRASNNEAEYEALLLGLKAARNLGISRATLYSDSQLAIQQSNGKFEIKDDKMRKYAKALDTAKEGFTELNLELISRAENIKADHLACLASALNDRPDPIVAGRELVSQLETLDDMLTQVPEGDWRYDIHTYLTKKELPNDNKKAKEVKRRALRFVMIDQNLFKRSFSQPLLKCLGPDEANYVLREIHEGSCGSHLGSLALARKALLAGFFWPTMRKDSSDLVHSFYNCQRHANLQWRPAEYMKAVVAACPFDQWGMDIVGPFPVSTGQRKFLLVAVDYFSKWVEAEPLAKITENEVLNFLWKNIVCRFGIPRRLVSDNGRQFCGSKV